MSPRLFEYIPYANSTSINPDNTPLAKLHTLSGRQQKKLHHVPTTGTDAGWALTEVHAQEKEDLS